MAIGINGYSAYGNNTSLLEMLNSSESEETSTSGNSTSSSGMTSALRSQIDSILENIPKGEDGKLSFAEVEEYLETKQEAWDESVKADFEELGINTYDQFPLSYDAASGTVVVAAGHPDKQLIDNYFANNQDKVDELEEIIQIGKLTRTSSQNLSTTELKQSLQQTAMSVWFEDNTDPSSWFSGGGLMFGGGALSLSGLNITV